MWEPRTGRRRRSFHANGNVYALAFSPDGSLLATGTNNNGGENVTLWDVKTGNYLGSVSLWNVRVEQVVFSPDGSTLAAGGWAGAVVLWNVEDILP